MLVGTRTRKDVTLVSVVLGTQSTAARDRDSLALLRWGSGQYRRFRPAFEGTVIHARPRSGTAAARSCRW